MRNEHLNVLKEITEEAKLISISGGDGTGQWETGASGVWAGIMASLGYSCSLPGNFYGGGGSFSDGGYGGASGPGGYGGSSSANSGS